MEDLSKTKTRKEIIELIDAAFADAEIPRSKLDITTGGIDGPYVVKHFLGKDRSQIDSTFFQPTLHMEDFTYMTAEAIKYYLPCVLKIMMEQPYDDTLWIFLRSFLKNQLEDLRALNAQQFEAISEWSSYLNKEWEGTFLSDEAGEAVKLAKLYK